MLCLKCGKDTKDAQVFCPECLAGMEKYPVRPDVHIQLPKRNTRNNTKKNAKKKRAPSPEELVEILRAKNRRLLVVILALVLLLGAATYGLLRGKDAPDLIDDFANWGKNYTVETSSE